MKRVCATRTKMTEREKNSAVIAGINVLNDDCFFHIFRYLPPKDKLSFSKVCKRWNNLSENYWTETKLTIFYDFRCSECNDKLTFKDFRAIMKLTGSSLADVSFENNTIMTYSNSITLEFHTSTNCKYKLEESTVSRVLALLSKFCQGVKTVGVCLSQNFPVGPFFKFLSHNKRVEALVVDGNCKFYLKDLHKIDSLMKSLKRLKFVCCFDAKNKGTHQLVYEHASCLEELEILDGNFISNSFLESLSKNSTQLKKLHLQDYAQYGALESSIKLLLQLQLLKELSLKGFKIGLTDASLMAVLTGCSKLEKLWISGCPEVTHIGLSFTLANCTELQILVLQNLSRVEKLINGQQIHSNLKELRIYDCPKLSVDEVCRAVSAMPYLTTLETDNADDDKTEFERLVVSGINISMDRNQNFLVGLPHDDEEYEIVAYKTAASQRVNSNVSTFALRLSKLRPFVCLSEREVLDIVVNHVRDVSTSHKVFTYLKKNKGTMSL